MTTSLLNALRKKAQESPPIDLFDLLTTADKESNRLLVEIATMIHDRRKDLEFSQQELASILKVTQPMISQYESGDYNFTIETLAQVCDALKLKISLSFEDVSGMTLTQFKDNDGDLIDCKDISEAA